MGMLSLHGFSRVYIYIIYKRICKPTYETKVFDKRTKDKILAKAALACDRADSACPLHTSRGRSPDRAKSTKNV